MANSLSRPSPISRTSPSGGFARSLLMTLVRTALLLGGAAALATVSLGAAVLALTAGSALVLAWIYRDPWPLNWLTGLPPVMAAALALLAQTAIPLTDLGAFLLPGAGVGATVGLLAGLRHRVELRGGRAVASPVGGLALLWGAGLLAGQGAALSGDVDLAGYGVVATGFTSALLAAFFLVLLVRRLAGRPVLHPAAASLLACLLLGLATPGLAQDRDAGHDVDLQDVMAGRVGGLSVRLTGGAGFASGRLIAHFTNDAGRTFRVGVPPGLLFRPLDASDPPDMRSSSFHVLDVPPGSGAHQIQASATEGYEPGGECTPRVAPSPTSPNVLIGVACPLPHHEYGIAGEEGTGADPGLDPGMFPPPDSYVPRHLLVEGGEQAGAVIGLSVLLAGLIGSIGLAIAQGASAATSSAVPPVMVGAGEGPSPGAVPPESPAPGEGPAADSGATSQDTGFPEGLVEAIRRRRIDWLASGGQLPESLTGSPPQTPWGGDGYRTWRRAMEAVDTAVQRTRDPDDTHDPTRIKQEEMEDYHRFETMRRGNQAGRAVRAVTAGAGDVASDPKPGLRTALTGGLHSLWDALGPDPTNIPESLVDPRSEYRDLVEAWRSSQSWSRWLRTRTPGKPSDIREMIGALRDERHAEEMAHIGDDEYFADEDRKWDEELRRLRAIEDWLGRAGGQP